MDMYPKSEVVGLSGGGSPNGEDERGAFIPAAAVNESVRVPMTVLPSRGLSNKNWSTA